MKKEDLILVLIMVAFFAMLYRCAHAQTGPPTPDNENQKFIYMRGDTVFQIEADGVEVPLLPAFDFKQRELGYFVSISEDSTGKLISTKVKIPKLEIVQADTIIWGHNIYYSCGVSHEHGRQCFTPMNPYTLEVIPSDTLVTTTRADSVLVWQEYGWVTDSIKWVPIDTTFEGDCKCEHDWVFGTDKPGSIEIHFIFGFEFIDCIRLNPDGKHCNEHLSATREKICRKCLRGVIERERWFQHYVASSKSEFERLKERQRLSRCCSRSN